MTDRDRLIELIADKQQDFQKWCLECEKDKNKDHQPFEEYLADKMNEGETLGFDGRVVSTGIGTNLEKKLADKRAKDTATVLEKNKAIEDKYNN